MTHWTVLAADIETDIINIVKPEINLIGVSVDGEDIFFDSAQQFLDFLFSAKNHTICVFHNMQFDMSLLLRDAKLPTKNFAVDVININDNFPRFCSFRIIRKWTTSRGKKKQRNTYIYIIDLMNFVKFKLIDLMKTFTPELAQFKEQYVTFKSLTGIEAELNVFDLSRCKADIQATRRIYSDHFLKFLSRRKREFPFLSTPQLAKHDLIERSNYEWETKKGYKAYRPKWLVEMERKSYFGGIVYVNERFRDQWIDNAKYYDVNSLYPFVMRQLKVPIGFKEVINCHITNLDRAKELIIRSYCSATTFTLFEVTVTTTEPVLIAKGADGLNELPVGSISGYYCENELYSALDRLSSIKITKRIIYTAERDKFQSFVDHWYTIRNEAKRKKDQVNNLLAKLMLNSAYGSFGRVKVDTKVFLLADLQALDPTTITTEQQVFLEAILDYIENPCFSYHLIYNGVTYTLREEFDRFVFTAKLPLDSKAIVIVASAITAGARAYLMSSFNPETVIYCDTDSQVRTDNQPSDEFTLGGWKIEREGKFIVHGKKDYEFITDSGEHLIKLKGVPRKAVKIDDNTYAYTRFIKPREAHRRKLTAWTLLGFTKKVRK